MPVFFTPPHRSLFSPGQGDGPALLSRRSKMFRYGLPVLIAAGWLALIIKPLHLVVLYASPPRVFLKDFMQEWLMARAVMEGVNPYLPLARLAGMFFHPPPDLIALGLPSPHPPPVVLLTLFFGLMNYPQAALVWLFFELACIGASVYIVLHWWQRGQPSLVRVFFVALLLLAAAPFWEGLLYGQLSSLLLLLLLCAWRSQRQIWAGCFLGASLSLKLMGTPIWLFFLIRKQWYAAGAALGVFITTHAAAALVMGFGPLAHYYRSVAGSMAHIYQLAEWNFSLWTMGWRLFNGVRSPFEQSTVILPLFQKPGVALYTSALLLVSVLGAGLLMAAKSKDRNVSWAVLFCLSAVVGPIAWIHYLALLLLPFALVLNRLKRRGYPLLQTALWAVLAGALLIPDYALINLLVFFDVNSTGTGPVTVSFWAGLPTLVPLAVTLALMGLVVWSAKQEERQAAPPE